MYADDWTQIRVEVGLAEEIDKIIQREKIFGARRYYSRTDFVKDAVLRLLQEYYPNSKDAAALRRKNKGEEEILVAGK